MLTFEGTGSDIAVYQLSTQFPTSFYSGWTWDTQSLLPMTCRRCLCVRVLNSFRLSKVLSFGWFLYNYVNDK